MSAGISSLPQELLSIIFETVNIECLRHGIFYAVLHLAHVSRLWDEVARNTSRLWDAIQIDYFRKLELVELFLELSKTRKLCVHIDLDNRGERHVGAVEEAKLHNSFQTAIRHVHRWHECHVVSSTRRINEMAEQLHMLAESSPNGISVETLHVHLNWRNEGQRGRDHPSIFLDISNGPSSIHSLSLFNVAIVAGELDNLVNLELGQDSGGALIEFGEFGSVIKCMSRLRNMTLEGRVVSFPVAPGLADTLTSQSLESIRLKGIVKDEEYPNTVQNYHESFISYISLPSTLICDEVQWAEFLQEALIVNEPKLFQSLKSLELKLFAIDEEWASWLADYFPSLKKVTLRDQGHGLVTKNTETHLATAK